MEVGGGDCKDEHRDVPLEKQQRHCGGGWNGKGCQTRIRGLGRAKLLPQTEREEWKY